MPEIDVRTAVTVSQALLLYGREEAENLRNEILRNAPLARMDLFRNSYSDHNFPTKVSR